MRYFVFCAIFASGFILPSYSALAGDLSCKIFYHERDNQNNPAPLRGRAHCFSDNNINVFTQNLGVLDTGNTKNKVKNVMSQIRSSYASQYDKVGIDISDLETQPQYTASETQSFCGQGTQINVFVRSGNGNLCD
ncbi:MAG: hypothetical protein GC137_01045 [Alphaproteobacteria bacterium]|nr:hypothetical protein [Alphaproteobacteria bacterium]